MSFQLFNILELTCKWNSCFNSGEVVLPLQLQIEHQLARKHVQLQKLARDGLLKQSLHRSIACAYAMRLWLRSLSRSYCRLMAFFLATMIVKSGSCLLLHTLLPLDLRERRSVMGMLSMEK